ncbi:MAG: MotA/TolQ/ExbB proton channel family protein [Planctomycetota bacterium]
MIAVSQGFAAAPTPGAAADPGSEIPSNPFLLLLQNSIGDPISLLIIALSVVAVTLIIQGALRIRRSVLLPEESTATIQEMIEQRRFKELIEFTENDDSFVSASLNPALKRAPSFVQMREALETMVAEETAEEFRKLEYINILANVGPLLGLMGTVYGIMEAFVSLASSGGSANPAELASGISTALGTTLLGLILAVPCLVAYGIFRNRADRITTEGALQAEEFLLMMKPEETKRSSSSGRSSTSAQPKPAT